MANLLLETKEILEVNGKTIEDIKWVGNGKYFVDINKFLEISNTDYDDGYGSQQVACDLIVVGDDWWLERREYDGSEWWELKSMPSKPEEYMDLKYLTVEQAEKNGKRLVGWSNLKELNKVEIKK